jgi:hypothetical protein
VEYTLAQAAEETGKSKSTVFRAFKRGRLTGRRDEQGTIWIEQSELDRWNGAAQQTRNDDPPRRDAVARADAPAASDASAAELAVRVEMLERMLAKAEETIADLRSDRDALHEEHMTALRRLPPPSAPEPAPVTAPPRRRWWQR